LLAKQALRAASHDAVRLCADGAADDDKVVPATPSTIAAAANKTATEK
jgi:hypothetical protein